MCQEFVIAVTISPELEYQCQESLNIKDDRISLLMAESVNNHESSLDAFAHAE